VVSRCHPAPKVRYSIVRIILQNPRQSAWVSKLPDKVILNR
jgi:hypothetical protein